LPKHLFADPLECTGCKLCEIVCSFVFEGLIDPSRSRIRVLSLMPLDQPIACRNCARAPCVDACPVGALYRDARGVVLVDEGKCIGCGSCVEVCPFGAIRIHPERGVAIKCVLCGSCVEWCPVGCLRIVDEREMASSRGERYLACLHEALRERWSKPGVKVSQE